MCERFAHFKIKNRISHHNKEIAIYIIPDLLLMDLVDIVIHEYAHYLQNNHVEHPIEYHKKLGEVGYWDNEYKVAAKALAKKHRENCYKWMMSVQFGKRIV